MWEDVHIAIQGGTVDVMLTHEAVNGGTTRVDDIVSHPNHRLFTDYGLMASARSRGVVTKAWDLISPSVLFHGHMHVKDEHRLPDLRRVYSMAADERDGNIGILDLADLSWRWITPNSATQGLLPHQGASPS